MRLEKSDESAIYTYVLIVYILLVNKVIDGLIYILKPKFTDSIDFSKNVNKEAT